MNLDNAKFDHLIKNLKKITRQKSILNYELRERAFFSIGKGNLQDWLEKLLPTTRLIIEPKIIGISIAIHYKNGKLQKVITKYSIDLTHKTKLLMKIPKEISIKQTIEILGQLYKPKTKSSDKNHSINYQAQIAKPIKEEIRFCAYQILNCKLNHFQTIKELEKLNFEVPQTEFTKDITDVHLYKIYWRKGMIFNSYPTNGIILKINSNKLQKQLGDDNDSLNWAYPVAR